MSHLCHALRCKTPVPPKMFMCGNHWRSLPKVMQDKMWALYVPGQEIRKDPTRAYISHAMSCVRYVAALEGIPKLVSHG